MPALAYLAEGKRGRHDPNQDIQRIFHQLTLLHQDGLWGLQQAPAKHLQLPVVEPAEPVEGIPSGLREVGLLSVARGAAWETEEGALSGWSDTHTSAAWTRGRAERD